MKQSKFYKFKQEKNTRRKLYQKYVLPALMTIFSCCLYAQVDIAFNYTGAAQTWTVPEGVYQVDIIADGAQGGSGQENAQGGFGGRVYGELNVIPGDVLHIYVGGQGGTSENSTLEGGGWNGGGHARGASTNQRGGGGGASDVRYNGTFLSERVIVGAGGGGGGTPDIFAGNGGGETGDDSEVPGYGGTQTIGGTSVYCNPGALLYGGNSSTTGTCAGGGAGYFGGGAGVGGGGGSSYIGGVINGEYLAGGRTGDGIVRITYFDVTNDLCENPILIGCGDTIFGNTENATPDNPPCRSLPGTGGGLWYSFIGTGEEIIVSTCHSGTDYDTYLSVYANGCNEPICIASNDNSSDCNDAGKSQVNFFASSGGLYRILVDGPNGAEGNFQLTLICGDPCLPMSITCPQDVEVVCGTSYPPSASSIEEFETQGGTFVPTGCDDDTYTIQSQGIFSENCSEEGALIHIREYTITNNTTGESVSCEQSFFCADLTPLEVICPADITLECGGDVPPAATTIMEFMDIGGSVSGGMCFMLPYGSAYQFTVDDYTEGDKCDGMTVTREYRIYSYQTEEVIFCIHNIYIPEIGVPTLTTQPPFEIECAEELQNMDLYSFLTVTYPKGLCQGNSTLAYLDIPDYPFINCDPTSLYIEYVYFDECENEVFATQQFILDNDGIQVDFPEDEIVECIDDIQVSPEDVSVSALCGVANHQVVITGPDLVEGNGSGCNGSVYKVLYSFTDACNGFHSHERFFTVQNEGVQVVIAEDQVVECEDDIEVSEDDVVATTPCGIHIEAEFDGPEISDPSHPNCSGVTHTYRYYFTDECGEFYEYFRTFTIQNQELTLEPVDPNLIGVEDGEIVFIQCQSNTDDWGLPQYDASSFDFTAACNLEADIEYTFEDLGAANCTVDGYAHAYSYTWTVSDECGANASFSFIIRVVDEIDPVLYGVPSDITLECNEDLPLPPTVTATDECECADVFYKEENLNGEICSGNRIVLRTWTAKDCCGNEVSQSQRITVEDNTAPEISYQGLYFEDIVYSGGTTIECSDPEEENWLYSLDANSIVVVETCSDDYTVSYSLSGYTPPSCAVAGYKEELEPTWTVTDDCGNSSTFSFLVRVEDNTAPYLLKSDILYLCEDDQDGFAWVEDDCSNALWDESEDLVEGCGEGIYYRTYSMEDECGNTSSDKQLIIDLSQKPDLIDFIEPVELPLTIHCTEDDQKVEQFNKNSVASIVDCIPNLEIAYYENRLSQPCVDGTAQIEYIWTATTPCGYVDSLVLKASLIDEVPPIFDNMIDTVYLSCTDEMPHVKVTDECSDVEVDVETNTSEWGCKSDGAIERIVTATDACGNKSQMTQMVYILDEEGPVFDDAAVICYSENTEKLTAYDECSGEQIMAELIKSERILCGNYDIIINTYSATDACGNETQFTQNVYPDDFEITIHVLSKHLNELNSDRPNIVNESEFSEYDFIHELDSKSVVAETPCQLILDAEFDSTVRFNEDCEDGISRVYTLSWTFKTGCNQEEVYEVEIHVKNDEEFHIELIDVDPIYCDDVIPELEIKSSVEEYDYQVIVDDQRDENGDGQVIRAVTMIDNCGREHTATQVIEFYNTTDLVCEIDGNFSPACNTTENYYTVNITGGTAPYIVEWTANGGECSIEWAEGETANINIGFGQANIQVRVTDANGCESYCDAQVFCLGMLMANPNQEILFESNKTKLEETITSTESMIDLYEEFKVYPNPFMSDINIEIPEEYLVERIDVVDTKGKTVVSNKIDITLKEVVLNLQDLKPGIYFIMMSTQEKIVTKKVVRL